MKVAIRVDSSSLIGSGHVYRCLTLAQKLSEQGADCHFVMRAHKGAMFDMVTQAGFTAHPLPAPPLSGAAQAAAEGVGHSTWLGLSPDVDAAETAAVLKEIGHCDWLVIDHYAIDAHWERKFFGMADRLMVIDDLADRPHDCDLLLDQNLQERPNRYLGLLPDRCKMLIGPRYALLRPEFAAVRAADVRDAQRPASKALVFLGGVDQPDVTSVALAALERTRPDDLLAHVVIGAANTQREILEREWGDRDWIQLHHAPTDILSLMRECDIAIGAGGTATWERCCLGLPSIIVSIANNQRAGAEAMNDIGAALYVGDYKNLSENALDGAIAVLLHNSWTRKAISRTSTSLVDALGGERIARMMRTRSVTMRRANENDAMEMLAWRNSPWARQFARDASEIRSEDHMIWFAKTLAASERELLIGDTEDGPAGVVRFDCDGNKAEISIFLVPGRQGQGIGSDLIRAALDWLQQHRPEVGSVDAEILEINLPSRRAFISAGFQPASRIYRWQN